MWTIHLASRPAVCRDCKEKVGAYAPRVDWSTEGLDWEKGNLTRRYCLRCGMLRLKAELKTIHDVATQGVKVWNMVHKRYGYKKHPDIPWPKVKWPKDLVRVKEE